MRRVGICVWALLSLGGKCDPTPVPPDAGAGTDPRCDDELAWFDYAESIAVVPWPSSGDVDFDPSFFPRESVLSTDQPQANTVGVDLGIGRIAASPPLPTVRPDDVVYVVFQYAIPSVACPRLFTWEAFPQFEIGDGYLTDPGSHISVEKFAFVDEGFDLETMPPVSIFERVSSHHGVESESGDLQRWTRWVTEDGRFEGYQAIPDKLIHSHRLLPDRDYRFVVVVSTLVSGLGTATFMQGPDRPAYAVVDRRREADMPTGAYARNGPAYTLSAP
jgi:hypothetical protein